MSGFTRSFVADRDTGLEICHFVELEQSFPPHFHEYYLLGCLLAGERSFIINGQATRIGPGDIVLLNPCECHACKSLGPCEWLCAHIPTPLMCQLTGSKENFRFSKNIFHSLPVWAMLIDVLAQTPQVCALLLPKFIKTILGKSLMSLHNHSASAGRLIWPDMGEYLEQNLETKLSLDALSQWAGMDKFEFLRKFCHSTGLTPHRYLEAIRINHGRKLLRAGASIVTCAVESGFYDQSHFNNSFRKNTGLTPAFFRSAYYASRDGALQQDKSLIEIT